MQENLTEHEAHMCDMLVRKMRGLPVEIKVNDDFWDKSNARGVWLCNTYRTPPRKITFPWELICEKWVALAMDKSGLIKLFSSEPTIKTDSWSVSCMFEYCDCPLKIDTSDINWRDSLTLREDK